MSGLSHGGPEADGPLSTTYDRSCAFAALSCLGNARARVRVSAMGMTADRAEARVEAGDGGQQTSALLPDLHAGLRALGDLS